MTSFVDKFCSDPYGYIESKEKQEKMKWNDFLEYCDNPIRIPSICEQNYMDITSSNKKMKTLNFTEDRAFRGQCVRYIGLVQDICDKEYYNGVVEEVNVHDSSDRKQIYGKYSDNVQSTDSDHYLDFDSGACKIFERQPVVSVPLPGQSAWTHSSPSNFNGKLFQYKQGSDEEHISMIENNSIPVGQKRVRNNTSSVSPSVGMQKRNTYLLKFYPDIDDLFDNFSNPQAAQTENIDTCIEKNKNLWRTSLDHRIYEDVRLYDMIEVIAIMPRSASTDLTAPVVLHCLLARKLSTYYPLILGPSITQIQSKQAILNRDLILNYISKQIANPLNNPAQCLYINDICEYILLSLLSSGCKAASDEDTMVGYMPLNLFFGDGYPLRRDIDRNNDDNCDTGTGTGTQEHANTIISTIYSALSTLLPRVLPPNTISETMHNEQFFISTREQTEAADQWVSGGVIIDPATLHLNLNTDGDVDGDDIYRSLDYSIPIVNGSPVHHVEVKSAESELIDRIIPSTLQCAMGTLVILDETTVQSGVIPPKSKENMTAIHELCTKQNILLKYNPVDNELSASSVLKIPVNNPILSISQSRSLFLHHDEYVSYWLPIDYCVGGGGSVVGATKSYVGSDSSDGTMRMDMDIDTSSMSVSPVVVVENSTESMDCMRRYLAGCRNLILDINNNNNNGDDVSAVNAVTVTMSDEVIVAVETYFVDYQRQLDDKHSKATDNDPITNIDPLKGTRMLHRLLTLARLITISYCETEISIFHWKHAIDLEQRRFHQSITKYESLKS